MLLRPIITFGKNKIWEKVQIPQICNQDIQGGFFCAPWNNKKDNRNIHRLCAINVIPPETYHDAGFINSLVKLMVNTNCANEGRNDLLSIIHRIVVANDPLTLFNKKRAKDSSNKEEKASSNKEHVPLIEQQEKASSNEVYVTLTEQQRYTLGEILVYLFLEENKVPIQTHFKGRKDKKLGYFNQESTNKNKRDFLEWLRVKNPDYNNKGVLLPILKYTKIDDLHIGEKAGVVYLDYGDGVGLINLNETNEFKNNICQPDQESYQNSRDDIADAYEIYASVSSSSTSSFSSSSSSSSSTARTEIRLQSSGIGQSHGVSAYEPLYSEKLEKFIAKHTERNNNLVKLTGLFGRIGSFLSGCGKYCSSAFFAAINIFRPLELEELEVDMDTDLEEKV